MIATRTTLLMPMTASAAPEDSCWSSCWAAWPPSWYFRSVPSASFLPSSRTDLATSPNFSEFWVVLSMAIGASAYLPSLEVVWSLTGTICSTCSIFLSVRPWTIFATAALSAAVSGAPSLRSNRASADGVKFAGNAFSCNCAAWMDS